MKRKEKCEGKHLQSLLIIHHFLNRIKIETHMGMWISIFEKTRRKKMCRINSRRMHRRMSRYTLLEGTCRQKMLRITFHYGSSGTSRMPIDFVKVEVVKFITTVGDKVFKNGESLTSIKIPNLVTTVSNNMDQYCTSLTSIVIPSFVTTIDNNVFQYCKSLTYIEISSSVTTIGNNMFKYYTSLTSIVIPNSVTTIVNEVFYYCFSLTSIVITN